MFHSDISYSQQDKAILFSEDAKTFLTSYKDAISYIKDMANYRESKAKYFEFAKEFLSNYKKGLYVMTKLSNAENSFDSPFQPTFSKDDEDFKLSRFAYNFYAKHSSSWIKAKDFAAVNDLFDNLNEHLKKETKI